MVPAATPTQAVPTQTPVPTGFNPPVKGCSIDFPERELYSYDMDLTLDIDKDTIGGHVVFSFYNDSEEDWNELCLRDYPSVFTKPEETGFWGSDVKAALTAKYIT